MYDRWVRYDGDKIQICDSVHSMDTTKQLRVGTCWRAPAKSVILKVSNRPRTALTLPNTYKTNPRTSFFATLTAFAFSFCSSLHLKTLSAVSLNFMAHFLQHHMRVEPKSSWMLSDEIIRLMCEAGSTLRKFISDLGSRLWERVRRRAGEDDIEDMIQ